MRQNVNRATGAADKRAGVFVRSLVVLASLASLCVSDGTGPRLIPFPSRPPQMRAEPVARADAARGDIPTAVRSGTRAASAHEPKAVTPVWNNVSLGRAALSPPAGRPDGRHDLYASPGYSFRNASSTRGRAPPRATPAVH